MSSDSEKTKVRDVVNPHSLSMQDSDFPSIGDQWEVIERLGEGGMSVVYKVKHRVIGKFAAAKLLHRHLVYQGKNLQRFQQESIATGSISHENIISVVDCGITEDSQPYMIMDFIQGESLANIIKTEHKLEAKRTLAIAKQICYGVQAAHNAGIIHRDLKPSNIMLLKQAERADFVKIVDFGIAKIIVDDSDEARAARHHLTETGEIFGSPLYMSPEQCGGAVPDARSDIYSIGVLLYEALAGAPPLMGQNHVETLFKQINETAAPLPNPEKDPLIGKLDQIIAKAMAKDPADRYQNMAQILADLDLAESGSVAWMMGGQAPRDLPNIWKKTNQRKITSIMTLLIVAVVGTAIIVPATILSSTIMQKLKAAEQTSQSWWMFYTPKPPSEKKYKAALKEASNKVAMTKQYYDAKNVQGDLDYATALYDKALIEHLLGQNDKTEHTISIAKTVLNKLDYDDGTSSAQNLRNKFAALSAVVAYLQNPNSTAEAAKCAGALSNEIATNGRKSRLFETWMQASGQLVAAALKQNPLPKVTFRPTKKLLDQMISLCEPTRDAELLAKCFDAKALLILHHQPVQQGNEVKRDENIQNLFQSALDQAQEITGPSRQAITDHIMMDMANTTPDQLESWKLKLKVATSPALSTTVSANTHE